MSKFNTSTDDECIEEALNSKCFFSDHEDIVKEPIAENNRHIEELQKLMPDNPHQDCDLHSAVRLGDLLIVSLTLQRYPGIAGVLDRNGYSALHLASEMGDVDIVRALLRFDSKLCLVKDKFGMTPLYTAVRNGRVDVMEELLKACDGSLMQVTGRSETLLHIAVQYNQGEAVQVLVNWLQQTNKMHLINSRDLRGNTVLHLATTIKQLPTIEILLRHNSTISAVVEINAMNAGGFTALDILDVLPQCGEMDMEIDKILRRAGALRAKDIFNDKDFIDSYHSVALVIATLLATMTFQAGLNPPGGTWEGGNTYESYLNNLDLLKKQNSTLTRWFIFYNSVGFFTSVAMIMFFMHDVPWKPWLFLLVSSLVGSYSCAIMEMSPREAPALIFLGIAFVLWAAVAPRRRTSHGIAFGMSDAGATAPRRRTTRRIAFGTSNAVDPKSRVFQLSHLS